MLNKEELKLIANKNETAKNIFYVLGTRQRTRHTIDLGRFRLFMTKQFGGVNDQDFQNTFDDLAGLGIGRIADNKFIWSYDLIQVARFAMNGEKSPEAIGERRARKVVRPKIEPKPAEEPVKVVAKVDEEQAVFPGIRVDIRKGSTTISTTLNQEQLVEMLKKLG